MVHMILILCNLLRLPLCCRSWSILWMSLMWSKIICLFCIYYQWFPKGIQLIGYIRLIWISLKISLDGVAQWIECQPANQKVRHMIPGQGICLGCSPGPGLGVFERQPIHVSLTYLCFSPFLSPSFPLSLKVNKLNIFFNRVPSTSPWNTSKSLRGDSWICVLTSNFR